MREHRVEINNIELAVIEWKHKTRIYLLPPWIIPRMLYIDVEELKCRMLQGYVTLTPAYGLLVYINPPICSDGTDPPYYANGQSAYSAAHVQDATTCREPQPFNESLSLCLSRS